ncbi:MULTISPECIES: LLM class F420-dependent oxidoreductase [Amycolatopsis]|uniref:LLM class F420-dependent oxidoreductase n=1 Tax=Amycolatopsis TaxID=1813 RepID=UPI0004263135|nr:LLM class F420-dependent oxidoreductase [Amycolatopsis thermoflava]
MEAGVQFFPSADSISPVGFARAAEDRGFGSVFFPDHTHVPVGADSPGYYRTVFDPLVTLGAVAASTTRIRIGTAVCLVPQRDPVVLAKQIATLDQLSRGRLLLGVGAGSDADELRNHGTDPGRRFAVLRERLAAMTAIWTQDEAAYHGEFVRFGPLWSWPKPVQRPRPPVLLGGMGPRVLERVVAFADGWMPYRAGTDQVTDPPPGAVEDFEPVLARRVEELRKRAGDAGRADIPVTLFNACPHPAALDRYADMGIDRVVFWLTTSDEATTLRGLDGLAALAASL